MGDLKIRSTTYGGGDQSFIVKPQDITEVGCTIDLANFGAARLAEIVAVHGNKIPAGTALAKDAHGLFGPYDPDDAGTNETQTLTVLATGGTYKLTVPGNVDIVDWPDDDEDTVAIAEASTAAAVDAALETILGAGNVAVTGSDGGPFTITFGGDFASMDVPLLVGTSIDLSGAANTATVTAGTGGVDDANDGAGILFDDVPFASGATTGRLSASRIVLGAIYEAKLPFAAATAGTSGRVDAAFKADIPTIAFV
jgi:hypothetical protein